MTELYGKAAAAPMVNPSAIGRLLQEVSWEGGANLRRYRDGGCGRENVLTAEVLQALDFLPRDAFLGGILRAAHGADAARGIAVAEIESAAVSILDEVQLNPSATDRGKQLVVQPDALIRSANAYALVELKGLRANMFGQRSWPRSTSLRREKPGVGHRWSCWSCAMARHCRSRNTVGSAWPRRSCSSSTMYWPVRSTTTSTMPTWSRASPRCLRGSPGPRSVT